MGLAPYVSHSSQTRQLELTARGLAAVPAARPLLDAYLGVLQQMIERYREPDVENKYGSEDLKALELPVGLERELAQLLRDDPWTFESGGDQPNGSCLTRYPTGCSKHKASTP
jgi:hypothetical protein